MMSRWGLEGMRSFEQVRVANKECEREETTAKRRSEQSDDLQTSSNTPILPTETKLGSEKLSSASI